MLYRIWDLLQDNFFGLPVLLLVIVLLLFLAWCGIVSLGRTLNTPVLSTKIGQSVMLFLLILGGVIFYSTVLAGLEFVSIPEVILTANIFLVLAWELIGSLLLFLPRLQASILLFSWGMHASIAMIGFVDFSALAGCLLFTFIPESYLNIFQTNATLKIWRWSIHRVHAYFLINASIGIFSALFYLAYVDFAIKGVAGILFNVASIILLWPILSLLLTPTKRPIWGGLQLINQTMPKFMFGFLIFLCCFGLTPYLGLRTAGNFSMFSNLRTEGEGSNHLLLASNPFKIWDYQEDIVHFQEVDKYIAELAPKQSELEGNSLPVVEFRKKIFDWTQAGYKVPLAFKYQGKSFVTKDIVTDPEWQTNQRTWEMFLMDFRIIQPENAGPNLCRW